MSIWRIAEAKRSLSELVRRAEQEPQVLHNRDRLVAVVLGARDAREFLAWRERAGRPTLPELVAEMQRAGREDGYELPVEPRRDRPNPLLKVADARRHQRRQ